MQDWINGIKLRTIENNKKFEKQIENFKEKVKMLKKENLFLERIAENTTLFSYRSGFSRQSESKPNAIDKALLMNMENNKENLFLVK